MFIPRATYRLQFNRFFRLADALALVPYLHDLGISHIYSSPLFKAAPLSLHGYDVCDYNQLNPELGTEADLERLADALHEKQMGLVLDIVPNHMGISSSENDWWWDVLTHGKKSRFAEHFDIDWNPSEPVLQGKVLVPILGDEYEAALKKGEFQLHYELGKFLLGYHEHRLPISPNTAAGLLPVPIALNALNSDMCALDGLIRKQHYHLAFHGHGDTKLNYRRFFAVSSLAAVRVEEAGIFGATHSLLQQWLEKRFIDGLRVDHPDGLRDPAKYLQWLRTLAPQAWIVVEKILGSGESLPASWPVQGTTGYDFLNQVNGIFIDVTAEKAFTDLYVSFTQETASYHPLLLEKKRIVLKHLFAAELSRLVTLLARIASKRNALGTFPVAELQEAVAEVITCFPVYRSYMDNRNAVEDADMASIEFAVQLACEHRKDLPTQVFAFIQVLLTKPQPTAAARDFIARFQQLTGAVMAKGGEDTAFYCFNRFISQNEVGSDPQNFGSSPEDFHKFVQRQQSKWPNTQLTTSTHDTKRSEDVRARLGVLSEIPDLWMQVVQRWSAKNSSYREDSFPDRNAEYMFYQTLAGAWPLSEERVQAYMEKASHEAKQHTDWTHRNAPYERALREFISGTLRNTEFIADLEQFVESLSEAAAINSLAQTLVKLTAPGVPDIYQGCELWDFSLVDPDNRRTVDFTLRQKMLAQTQATSAETAWKRRRDGFPKVWLIQKTLKLREQISSFQNLDYRPLFASGARKHHVVAFSRGTRIITVVPRLSLKLKNDWQDTVLDLPPGNWHNEFTGEIFNDAAGLGKLFKKFPVAVLFREESV